MISLRNDLAKIFHLGILERKNPEQDDLTYTPDTTIPDNAKFRDLPTRKPITKVSSGVTSVDIDATIDGDNENEGTDRKHGIASQRSVLGRSIFQQKQRKTFASFLLPTLKAQLQQESMQSEGIGAAVKVIWWFAGKTIAHGLGIPHSLTHSLYSALKKKQKAQKATIFKAPTIKAKKAKSVNATTAPAKKPDDDGDTMLVKFKDGSSIRVKKNKILSKESADLLIGVFRKVLERQKAKKKKLAKDLSGKWGTFPEPKTDEAGASGGITNEQRMRTVKEKVAYLNECRRSDVENTVRQALEAKRNYIKKESIVEHLIRQNPNLLEEFGD